jgi:hypothetical protein
MKKQIFLCSAAMALIFFGSAVLHAQDNDGCKLSTLSGDYAFRVSGQVFSPSGAVVTQRDGVAMAHYDGAGNFTQADFVFANGVLVPGPADAATGFHINETGTYTVNPDCTGTATINFPAPGLGLSGAVIRVMFVLGNHGRSVHQIVSSLTPPGPTGKQAPVPANIHADGEKLGAVPSATDPNA